MQPEVVKLKEIKPALYGYVREANLILASGQVPADGIVHDVRVLMKKSRASVRLVKSQIDEEIFDREYLTFKETGRIMRNWRESSVHRKILRNLKKKFPLLFSEVESNPAVANLMATTDLNLESKDQIKGEVEKIKELLNKSLYRLRFMNMSSLDPMKLFDDLETSYQKVAGCYITARNNTRAQYVHEFRKRAKDFLYQLYIFRPINPKVVKDLEKRLDLMTQNLGKYNDLAVLISMLGYKFNRTKPPDEFDELVLLIKEEQDKYLSRVWPAAYRIFGPGKRLAGLLGFKVLKL